MNELQLIESKDLREEFIDRIDVLEKVKGLLLLPDIMLATTQQVADFFEVDIEAVKWHVKNNKDEIESDGYCIWKANDFKDSKIKLTKNRGSFEIEFNNGQKERFAPRGVALFTPQAILKIGFLLCDSEVANKLRKIISEEYPKLYEKLINGHRLRFKKHEQKFYDYLCFSFGKENLQKQVRCGSYLIDFILFDKIAIEIDEHDHNNYNSKNEKTREKYIKSKGYFIIRFNPHTTQPYELIENIIRILDKNLHYWAM